MSGQRLRLKFRPEEGMVGGVLRASRLDVYVAFHAVLGKRGGRKDVVDAPAFVGLQRARLAVVPDSVLLAAGMELAKDVLKSPRKRFLIDASRVFVKADMLEMCIRAMDVHRFRRHVHVSAPDRLFLGGEMSIE